MTGRAGSEVVEVFVLTHILKPIDSFMQALVSAEGGGMP